MPQCYRCGVGTLHLHFYAGEFRSICRGCHQEINTLTPKPVPQLKGQLALPL